MLQDATTLALPLLRRRSTLIAPTAGRWRIGAPAGSLGLIDA
jgi:hypothetical protein